MVRHSEDLLLHHAEDLDKEKTLRRRIKQCRGSVPGREEVAESMAMGGKPIGHISAGCASQSNTEYVALSLDDKIATMSSDVSAYVRELEKRLNIVEQRIHIYEAVMEGLTEFEKWLIEGHYEEGKTFEMLANEVAPDGETYSISTLCRKKKQIHAKADMLIASLCNDPA